MASVRRSAPKLAAAMAGLLLAGCASFSRDGGMDVATKAARDWGYEVGLQRSPGDASAARAKVAELLGRPLSADDAVQVALLNNRGLQASLQELGVREADVVQAGRLPNPHLALTRRSAEGVVSMEQALTLNVMSLLTVPLASEIERRRFESAKSAAALEVLRLATQARKAYYTAVSAEQTVAYMRQVRVATEAGSELAKRLAEAGNWSALAQARERSFHADAALQVALAERNLVAAREQLTRLMGLWGEDIAFRLPERLPEVPRAAEELPGIESAAMESRIDLRIARADAEAVARNLGLTRATRFVNVLEFGPSRERDTVHDPWLKGYEIGFELPIFDFGTAKVAKAEALYMQAVHRAAEAAVNARSEVRQAYLAYRTRFDVARHYRDEIVPLRKRIADETVLRYNGMLVGVFELLAEARSQIASVNAAIEAQRDFWIAKADLDMALVGKPSIEAATSAATPAGPAGANH